MLITTALNNGMKMHASAEEAAHIMKEIGFSGIDWDLSFDYTNPPDHGIWAQNCLAIAKTAAEAGLSVSQCHLPYYGGHLDAPGSGDYQAFEDLLLPDYEQSLKLCREAGCHLAVMHPFFTLDSVRGSVEGNVRMLRKLLPLMEECGVSVALENIYASREGHYVRCAMSDPENILAVIEKVDSPLVGACIDTGHANIFGIDIVKTAALYGSHLLALHANGNAGGDEHVIPLSMSSWCEKMDFVGFSKALREIGYTGTYNLELNSNAALPESCVRPFYAYAFSVAKFLSDLI